MPNSAFGELPRFCEGGVLGPVGTATEQPYALIDHVALGLAGKPKATAGSELCCEPARADDALWPKHVKYVHYYLSDSFALDFSRSLQLVAATVESTSHLTMNSPDYGF